MNKKFLTRLLNADFRRRTLFSVNQRKADKMKIPQYAQYVVDDMIVNRSKEHENDKDWHYGFTPINFLCAVKKNGIDRKIFEFNSVNYFLRQKNGEAAVEVVKCMLMKWVQEDPTIIDFDIDVIDAELRKAQEEYEKTVSRESEDTTEENS